MQYIAYYWVAEDEENTRYVGFSAESVADAEKQLHQRLRRCAGRTTWEYQIFLESDGHLGFINTRETV